MEVFKVTQNTWLRIAEKYLNDGLHRTAYLTVESPVVGVYRKAQVDEKTCNALGYEVVETYNNGSTVVHSKGDILFGHFAEIENDWYNRFVDYFVNWLKAKGLNADFVSNDIVVDGYKICGMCTTRYGRIDYTGGFISMSVNLDHIKAICKKPMEKVPKGLSEYSITTQEVEAMFIAFCKDIKR